MKKIPYTIWVKILIGIGIAIRVYQYLVCRSFFHDEALLARNVNELTFRELAGVLEYHQAAPVGLLWLTKVVVSILGDNEFAFRLFPLLAGIASIFLFHKIIQHFLKPPFSILALAFFVFNGYLLFYHISFKQYGLDVWVALVISWGFIQVYLKDYSASTFYVSGVVGALLIYFSQPSIFVLTAGTLTIGFLFLRAKKNEKFKHLVLASCIWGLSFLLYFFLLIKPNISDSMLQNFHTPYFMPIKFWELESWNWYIQSLPRMLKSPGNIHFNILGAIIAFIGIIWAFRKEQWKWSLLLLPILLAFGASALGKYSTLNRLMLFATPAIILFLVKGLEGISEKLKPHFRFSQALVFVLFGVLILQSFLNTAIHNTANPIRIENIKSLLQFVEDNKQTGDVLYVYFAAEPQFGYYQDKYDLEDLEIVMDRNPNTLNWEKDFEKLKGNPRVWVLMTHFKRLDGSYDDVLYSKKMNTFCTKILEEKTTGGVCFLYDCEVRE